MPKEPQIKSLFHTHTMLNIGLKKHWKYNPNSTFITNYTTNPQSSQLCPEIKTLEAISNIKAAKLLIVSNSTRQTKIATLSKNNTSKRYPEPNLANQIHEQRNGTARIPKYSTGYVKNKVKDKFIFFLIVFFSDPFIFIFYLTSSIGIESFSHSHSNSRSEPPPLPPPLSCCGEENGDQAQTRFVWPEELRTGLILSFVVWLASNDRTPETIQNMIGPNQTQKPVSPSANSSSSSSSSVASLATLTCSNQSMMEAASAISEGKSEAATEIFTRLTQVTNPRPNSEQRLLEFTALALKSWVNPMDNPGRLKIESAVA